jgi:hypothetical protein
VTSRVDGSSVTFSTASAGSPGVSSRHRADPRQQLVELERLDDVVVGALVEPGHAAGQRVAGGHHDHRGPVAAGAQRAQHLDAVALGQAEVEQDEVEPFARQRGVGGAAVAHPVDRVTGTAQRPAQAFTDHPVVFYEQQSHGWGRWP